MNLALAQDVECDIFVAGQKLDGIYCLDAEKAELIRESLDQDGECGKLGDAELIGLVRYCGVIDNPLPESLGDAVARAIKELCERPGNQAC